MSKRYHASAPDFLRRESDFPAIGMLNNLIDSTSVWKAARRLGVRLFEVNGWVDRKPKTFLIVHPDDVVRLPRHEAHQRPVLAGYCMRPIHRKFLKADRSLVRQDETLKRVMEEEEDPWVKLDALETRLRNLETMRHQSAPHRRPGMRM